MKKSKKSKPESKAMSLADAVRTEVFWDGYFEAMVKRAQSGKHPEDAKELLFELVSSLDNFRLPHRAVVEYFQTALGHILEGKDSTKALHLNRPSSRPSGKREDRHIEVAANYQLLVRAGLKKNIAKDRIGYRYGLSSKAVERIVSRLNQIPRLGDEELRALIDGSLEKP